MKDPESIKFIFSVGSFLIVVLIGIIGYFIKYLVQRKDTFEGKIESLLEGIKNELHTWVTSFSEVKRQSEVNKEDIKELDDRVRDLEKRR